MSSDAVENPNSDQTADGPQLDEPARVRIVIAEDEAIIRLDLAESLADEGYEVVGETGRGDEVVDLVRRLEPDVAILDIKMPGMDGIEAATIINGERLAAVLLLTAFSQRDLIKKASDAGVLAYLVKPFQRSELVPAIELALGRFRELRAIEGEAAALQERLETRKVLDRAKGRLMDTLKMSEGDAYQTIQQRAMEQRTTMRAIAEALLAEPSGPPG